MFVYRYKPWYLEECSSTLATTYSSGTPGHDKSVATVDMDGKLRPDHICTVEHTGITVKGCAVVVIDLYDISNPYTYETADTSLVYSDVKCKSLFITGQMFKCKSLCKILSFRGHLVQLICVSQPCQ